MAEYIDRDLVLHEVCHACNDQFDEDPCEPKDCSFRELIKALPAADVVKRDCFDRLLEENDMLRATLVPVRHGRWEWNDYNGFYYCSECGCVSPRENQDGEYCDCPNYCPNCGARMDGAE